MSPKKTLDQVTTLRSRLKPLEGSPVSGKVYRLQETVDGTIVVVDFIKDRLGAGVLPEVQQAFRKVMEANPHRVIVNFEKVTLVMSYVLRELMICQNKQMEHGGDLVFAGLRDMPLQTVTHSGLLAAISNCFDLEMALQRAS